MPIRHTSIKEVSQGPVEGVHGSPPRPAFGHPVREHILAVLNERQASPTEIGDELELDVSAFYKHVQVLERLGCIECVDTRRVRGVHERIFRATATLSFDDEAWATGAGDAQGRRLGRFTSQALQRRHRCLAGRPAGRRRPRARELDAGPRRRQGPQRDLCHPRRRAVARAHRAARERHAPPRGRRAGHPGDGCDSRLRSRAGAQLGVR